MSHPFSPGCLLFRPLPCQQRPDERKGSLLALLFQHREEIFQLVLRLRVHHDKISASFKVFPRTRIRVIFSLINLRRGNPVHHHLDQVAKRHFIADKPPGLVRCKIDPVFEMMLIASLVVQPRRRIALFFFFRRIWTAVSLIIFNTGCKFLPGILGQVVQKSLAVQSYRKASDTLHKIVEYGFLRDDIPESERVAVRDFLSQINASAEEFCKNHNITETEKEN